jgi:hypothetical protein
MRPTNEILIDYLDKQLSQEEKVQTDNMLQKDLATAGEMQYLKLALDTVRLDAISEKVSAIRQSFRVNETNTAKPATGVVRSMYTFSMRVAAILILVIGVTGIYKYISVNNESLYNKQFTGYELGNSRGQKPVDAEIEAYQNKNWNEVIAICNNDINKSNKSLFLAAMAEMQLNHFPQAIALFESILSANAKSGDNSFQQESEYYISLAYLGNHETDKSIGMLNKIKADTSNIYYPLVSKISYIDLKIIQLKK